MKLRKKKYMIQVRDRHGNIGYHCNKAGAQYNIHRATIFNHDEATDVVKNVYNSETGWYQDSQIIEVENPSSSSND